MKNMQVLVVGCGSIARRHIHNLAKLTKIKHIFVYTKSRECFSALDNSTGKILSVKNINIKNVDFALICNDTHKHLNSAISLAKRGVNLFIEKPISSNLVNTDKLKKIAKKVKIKVAIGYNFRFMKIIELIQELLRKKEIGKLYFARIEVGQYLPGWRKNSDYRECYSASSKRGGGVSLDLSHEIDYMRYLFGHPEEHKFIKTKVSDLEIDSDDVFEGLYRYKNNFLCSVHMDYLLPQKKRQFFIQGSRGSIFCDFVKMQAKIQRLDRKNSLISGLKYFDLAKTYIDEIKDFINVLESNIEPRCSIEDGIKALQLVQGKNV